MFRASIQRQVRLGHVARQLSTVSLRRIGGHERLALLCQASSQPALQPLTPRYTLSRSYSVQSDAVRANREDEFAPVSSAPVSRFGDLTQLGVHQALIDALVKGMGYDNMTEVQSMTINAALKGTDM